MSNHKKDAKVFDIDVVITNTVSFKVKSNNSIFLRQWLTKVLGPLESTLPPDTLFEIQVHTDPVDSDQFEAEVYGRPGVPGQAYEVLEHVKNELFGGINADSGDQN